MELSAIVTFVCHSRLDSCFAVLARRVRAMPPSHGTSHDVANLRRVTGWSLGVPWRPPIPRWNHARIIAPPNEQGLWWVGMVVAWWWYGGGMVVVYGGMVHFMRWSWWHGVGGEVGGGDVVGGGGEQPPWASFARDPARVARARRCSGLRGNEVGAAPCQRGLVSSACVPEATVLIIFV